MSNSSALRVAAFLPLIIGFHTAHARDPLTLLVHPGARATITTAAAAAPQLSNPLSARTVRF